MNETGVFIKSNPSDVSFNTPYCSISFFNKFATKIYPLGIITDELVQIRKLSI